MSKKEPRLQNGFCNIDKDRESNKTFEFLDDLPKRMKAFRRQAIWGAATALHEGVLEGIPTGKEYSALIKALKVGEQTGNKSPVFGVFVDAKAKGAKKIDPALTVIYIRRKSIFTKTKEEIELLINKGPWTADTLPFWPSKKDAIIIQRKVGKRQTQKIQRLQYDQREEIRRSLVKLGKKTKNSHATGAMGAISSVGKSKVTADVVLQMMTLEFGGGTQHPLALWRNSIKTLRDKTKKLVSKYKFMAQTLNDINFKNWNRFPLIREKVKASQFKTGADFFKRIGG